jgi:hypothetical protein
MVLLIAKTKIASTFSLPILHKLRFVCEDGYIFIAVCASKYGSISLLAQLAAACLTSLLRNDLDADGPDRGQWK